MTGVVLVLAILQFRHCTQRRPKVASSKIYFQLAFNWPYDLFRGDGYNPVFFTSIQSTVKSLLLYVNFSSTLAAEKKCCDCVVPDQIAEPKNIQHNEILPKVRVGAPLQVITGASHGLTFWPEALWPSPRPPPRPSPRPAHLRPRPPPRPPASWAASTYFQ